MRDHVISVLGGLLVLGVLVVLVVGGYFIVTDKGPEIAPPGERQVVGIGGSVNMGTYRDDDRAASNLVFTGGTADGRATFARRAWRQAWTEAYPVGAQITVKGGHSGRLVRAVFVVEALREVGVELRLVSWEELSGGMY